MNKYLKALLITLAIIIALFAIVYLASITNGYILLLLPVGLLYHTILEEVDRSTSFMQMQKPPSKKRDSK